MADIKYKGLQIPSATTREISNVVNRLLNGKINSTGTLTLDTGTASTAISDINVTVGSYINFMPTSADAATELGSGAMYVSSRDKATFTVSHSTSTASTRTFVYVVLA